MKILNTGLEKKLRKTVETSYITTEETTNHRERFVCLSRAAVQTVTIGKKRSMNNLSEININKRNGKNLI